MLRRAPKTTLGIATLLLAMLDWMAGSTIAEPDGRGDTPPDEMVPAEASLENGTASTAQIGPVAIRILPAGTRYVLEATNPTDTAQDIEVSVKVLETTVNPIARMAPMPQEVVSEKVALHCPPHGRVRQALVLAGLPPTPRPVTPAAARVGLGAGSNGNGTPLAPPFLSFRTREFVVADASANPEPRRAVQAQRSARSSVPNSLGHPTGQSVLRLALGPVAPSANVAGQ